MALLNYKHEHGSFPTAICTPPNGRAQSWRLLMLPLFYIPDKYLTHRTGPDFEEKKSCLANWLKQYHFDDRKNVPRDSPVRIAKAAQWLPQYHFDEPWNSSHNKQWTTTFIASVRGNYLYCIADRSNGDKPHTSYMMLTRPLSNGERGLPVDLPSDAVIVVESAGSGIGLLEPKDLNIEDILKAESPFGVGRLNSKHPKVVKALQADGHVIDIPKDITKEDLRKLLTGTVRAKKGT